MKKVFAIIIALAAAFTLIGCNVAPNVPRVTPYTTGGTNYNNNIMPYGANRNGTYNNNVGTVPFGFGTGNNMGNRTGTNNNVGNRGITNNIGGKTGTRNNNGNIPYGNRTGTYKSSRSYSNPANYPLVRSGVNPADKVLLPEAGKR